MTSLIRLRQRIVGERAWSIAIIVVGATMALFAIPVALSTQSFFTVLYGVLGLAQVVLGSVRLRAARRDLAIFEAEHGVGAGEQDPIR